MDIIAVTKCHEKSLLCKYNNDLESRLITFRNEDLNGSSNGIGWFTRIIARVVLRLRVGDGQDGSGVAGVLSGLY